jgi:hypothetical protein
MKKYILDYHNYIQMNEELSAVMRLNKNSDDFGIILLRGKIYTFDNDAFLYPLIEKYELNDIRDEFIEIGLVIDEDMNFTDIFYNYQHTTSRSIYS